MLVGFVYNNKTGYFTDLINKTGSTLSVSEGSTPEKSEKPKKEQTKVDLVQVLRADFEKMKIENNKKFESLNESVKWGNDRLTLITAVNQDNFLTVKKGGTDFIYINGDWKIDRLPQNLKLTEEDLEFLNKFYSK